MISDAVAGFESGTLASETVETVFGYLLERLPAHYEDLGHLLRYRERSLQWDSTLGDIDGRSLALQGFAGSDEAISLAAANKRVANILAKTEESLGGIDPSRFEDAAESTLFESLQQTQQTLDEALAVSDFAAALNSLAGLRGVVDNFFDQVLVNAEDDAIRLNRLALLKKLRGQFLRVADLAVLAR